MAPTVVREWRFCQKRKTKLNEFYGNENQQLNESINKYTDEVILTRLHDKFD